MAKGRRSRVSTAKRNSDLSNPTTLRARFLSAAIRKKLRHSKALSENTGQRRPQASAREAIGYSDTILALIRRVQWCKDVEKQLDSGTQFLHDHGHELSDEDREAFEQDLANLLDLYIQIC